MAVGMKRKPNTKKRKRRRMSIENALRLSLELDRQRPRVRRPETPVDPGPPLTPAELVLMPFV